MEFPGKVVAVTGAAGGIGQELCRYFASAGAAIGAFDRSASIAQFASELDTAGARIHAAVVDIGDSGRRARRRSRAPAAALGAIDILINNAGATHNPVLERTTPESLPRRRQRQRERRVQLRVRRAAGDDAAGGPASSSTSAR